MKTNMIITILLMMHIICARLEIYDIKTIGEKSFVIQGNGLLIHPTGPLNPLRGYIMYQGGYMYNKRFYTPEINTMYKLEKTNKVQINGDPIYNYIRKPINDEVYNDICEEKVKNEYLIQFHTQLIKMFPSTDGSLSIVSGKQDAMYSFLIKDRVQPQSMYILAALFLLSEGVTIPNDILCTEGGKRLVLKSIYGKTTYIDQKRPSNDLVNLFRFLKEYIDSSSANPNNMEGLSIEPADYEQFITGNFLNTKQFLIQSYIYEFIDTSENYTKFIEAVHTLLTEQIENSESTPENIEKCRKVLESCFIKENDRLSVTGHNAIVYDFIEIINPIRACPFIKRTELPAYARVKAYDRTNGKELDDEDQKYSNCVEAGILGLVCCLMYAPENRIYTTDHLPNQEETMPLKDFFKKHSKPTETTSQEMSQDWCRVVADLKNSNVRYIREKNNELDSSLLNILYVISDITGNKEEVLKEIKHIEEICSSKEMHVLNGAHESLTKIFKALSNNGNLEVKSKGFTVGKNRGKKLDLFGEFNLLYKFNRIKNQISICISTQHTRLGLERDLLTNGNNKSIKTRLTEIQNKYSNANGYTESIIKHYINIEMSKMINMFTYMFEPAKSIIRNSISTGGNNVLKLFLYGRIEPTDYKETIITRFLFSYNIEKQNDISLIRMADNIIGSAPLDDQYIRDRLLRGFICNPKIKKYYTKIEKDTWNDFIDNRETFVFLFSYLNMNTSDFDTTDCFISLMEALSNSKNTYVVIMENITNFIYIITKKANIAKDSEIEAFNQVIDIIKETCKRIGMKKLTDIYLFLFFELVSGIHSGFYMNSVFYRHGFMHLFNIIDNEYLIVENKKDIIMTRTVFSNTLMYLKNNSEMFCSNPENNEKYNKILEIVDIKISKSYY
ncbi:hypothetical protein NEIG_02545 [Nematocida sp. ERTm5]|nr:hypothetical protein NEIG_02545 [Nematocida sp. ERTm5]